MSKWCIIKFHNLKLRYTIDKMGGGQGFIVDCTVRICFPFDGDPFCVPIEEGLHLLNQQEIPLCSRNITQLFNKSKEATNCSCLYGEGWIILYFRIEMELLVKPVH